MGGRFDLWLSWRGRTRPAVVHVLPEGEDKALIGRQVFPLYITTRIDCPEGMGRGHQQRC